MLLQPHSKVRKQHYSKKVSMENRSAAFFKTPSHLPTNNVYGVTFKEMIVPKGNENIRPLRNGTEIHYDS